jgi:hypothetical protein
MNTIHSVNFDMDGTIANLYGRATWLEELRSYDPTPYAVAEVMLNMSLLARYIHKVQRKGIKVNIISWLSKEPNEEYDLAVTQAKLNWLRKHLPSVEFDAIYIVPYGTPKSTFAPSTGWNILFDDEERNIQEWEQSEQGLGFSPSQIIEVLKNI